MDQRSHSIGVGVLKLAIRRSAMDPSWGCTELAKCYLYGRGVRSSRSKALKYLKLAAAGDPEARHLWDLLKS